MNCETWRDQLDAFIDGELAADQLESMNAHVGSCPACAAEALAAMRLKRAMRDAGRRWAAPAELRRSVIEQARPSHSRWSLRVLTPYFAAAAVVVLAVFLVLRWQAGGERSAQELADLHVAALASSSPVDVVSTDRHTVKPWFQGRIPFSFDLPDVAGSPFALLGGRMAYLRQEPGAQLVYQYDKHRISVFVFRDTREADLSRVASAKVPFHLAAWTSGGLRYVAVSDAGDDVLRQLRERFESH